jgi:ABC-2 type transport system permease protein
MRPGIAIIIEIIKKEFYQIRQDRRMLLVSIMAPVLQVLLLGYAATTDVKNINMVVCDQDRTGDSRAFIREFTNSGYFTEKYRVETPDEGDRFIERGDASVLLVVPVKFGSNLLVHTPAQIQMILDGTDANTASVILGYSTQIVATYSQGILIRSSLLQRAGRIGSIIPVPRIWFNPDLKSSNFMVPGVVALVLMIITMTLTSLGVVKEKEIGTLEQLLVTPIKPYQLILGKLIPFTIIGFIDVTAVLAIARFWFHVPLVGNVPLLFALSGLFILTTLGLGLFISTVAKTQQQAMLIAQFFFFMPFMFLSGFAFPIENMPKFIQYVTYLIPLRYFLEIVRAIFLKGSGIAELWPQASMLFLIGVGVLTLSIARFRKRLN